MDLEKVVDGLIALTETELASDLLGPSGQMTDQEHLLGMLDQIKNGKKTGEKAHRWIGYIQGVLVSHNVTTVEEMRDLNR